MAAAEYAWIRAVISDDGVAVHRTIGRDALDALQSYQTATVLPIEDWNDVLIQLADVGWELMSVIPLLQPNDQWWFFMKFLSEDAAA